MPTFPTYRGELPQCLNPLNIRHYFLLAYWVYFRPTALHCYLYQASPECYQLRGLEKIRRTWHIPAYRSLYLMSIPAILLFVLLLGLAVFFWLWTWQSYKAEILHVNITSDNQRVISTLFDGTVKVWDLESGKLLHTLSNHTKNLTALAVTPDGQKVVASYWDRTIKIWDVKSGKLLHTLLGHTDDVNVKAVGMFPNGQRAFSISWDGSLKVWDLESGKLLQTLSGYQEEQGLGVIIIPSSPEPFDKDSVATAVTPDGKRIVSVSNESIRRSSRVVEPGGYALRVWDIENGKPPQILSSPSDGHINAVAVTPNGQKAISTSSYGYSNVWDIESGKLINTLPTMNGYHNTLAMTPDGQKIIFATYNKTLEVWDLKKVKLLHTLSGHTGYVTTMIITPDGKKAVSASGDGNVFWADHTLKVWDLESGKLLHTLSGHTDTINSVLLTSDGKKIVSASKDHTLKVWDLETGKAVPLWWSNGFNLIALGLVSLILVILTLIFFPVIVALSLITFNVAVSLIVGVVSSLSFSMVLTTATTQFLLFTIIGTQFNTLGIPALSSAIFSIVFIASFILFGMPFGIVCHSVSRRTFLVLANMIAITVISILIGIAINIGVALGGSSAPFGEIVIWWIGWVLIVGVGLSILGELGSSRLLFYPVQLFQALYSQFRRGKHPAEWDELLVLPLPGTQRLISQSLQQNEATGLEWVSELASNPFQRSAVQKALKIHLHNQSAPLHLLYKLITHPDLNTYIVPPVSQKDWKKLPTTGYLLLGELSGKWVDCSSDWANRWSERLVYLLTRFRRDKRKTPLTHFAEMLYNLLDKKTVETKNFNLSSYYDTCDRLTNYLGGEEIANSFNAMETFIHCSNLSSLPKAVDIVKQHDYATLLTLENAAIRPTVLTALIHLGEVGAEIATYQDATSKVNKQAALLRATDTLEKLEQYIADEVFPPEQAILQQIIEKWRKLVSEEGGEIGRAIDIQPIANPYIVGNPVTGSLFVGREDIMRRLEELWMPEQRPSVVIYGHRRMGKTSILKNLGARFGSKTAIIDFNMQRIGGVNSTGQLLYYLTVKLYDSLSADQQTQLKEPDRENFYQDPYFALDRFLQQLNSMELEKRFIIAVDEFEKIEEWIEEKRIEPELLDFWRGLIQTYPWFVMAFAGLHTLQEMTENYWHPLFGSVTAISVSFLSPKGAEQLIVQPTPDFELDYDSDAIEQIINLTNGQPYLVQLIAHTLVTRFNYQTFEEGIERERRFTLEDVEAIINTKEFYLAGNAYFQGVWEQAEKSKPTGQGIILTALSQDSLSLTEIANQIVLSLPEIQLALDTLQRHDVVVQRDGRFFYTVELMRRWVAEKR